MRKILIIGHARHGKDTVAEMIADYTGETYRGSSEICADFIFEIMKDKHGYADAKACFDDRSNHRAKWHQLIKDYNKGDKASLATLIFKDNLIYCGIRDTVELDAVIAKFDPLIIWVDASEQKRTGCYEQPLEPASSMNIVARPEWRYIHNSSSLADLKNKTISCMFANGYLAKWDKRFFKLAEEVASWSKDHNCKVGAILVSPGMHELATGYNGPPAGVDDKAILALQDKNKYTAHAEQNAIWNARRNLEGWAMYSTKPPCIACAIAIIQAGIAELNCPLADPYSSWHQEQVDATRLLTSAGVNVRILVDNVLVDVSRNS